jgi:hypothetical protein
MDDCASLPVVGIAEDPASSTDVPVPDGAPEVGLPKHTL